MSISNLSVESQLKPSNFVKLSWVDKLLPDYFSILRFLSVTDHSVIKAREYESFLPVELLRGVDLTKHKYVTLLGVVISGVWTIPEGCSGGATVGLVDTRMERVVEGTVCKFSVPASVREFNVRFIPNYSITAADAARHPWSLFVRLKGVNIKDSFSPLTLEIAALVATTNSIIKKSLKAIVSDVVVGSDAAVAIADRDSQVNSFFDSVPITKSVVNFDKSYKSRVPKKDSSGGSGKVKRSTGTSGPADTEFSDDGLLSNHSD
ncbi:28 kDa movement protein [Cucumber mottle virus]|uniref:Movement protein n=1 Tax=Cucumber mottle virus TaxID=388038 RepID=A0PA53_9VIRU|nr:28 kDa movement protein [Cucumber mottle virus]BAF37646.1 28 kDa movement protein [Cucumber mottle virus]